MTKKDYKMIAQVIDSFQPSFSSIPKQALVDRLANVFERNNPRFDRAKFLEECGVIYGEGR